MKAFIKTILPPKWRIQLRISFVYFKDICNGNSAYFSKEESNKNIPVYPFSIKIIQPIRKNAFSENKVHNLEIAAKKLEKVVIHPQEIFSFWHLIGEPSSAQNFKIGRAIVDDELSKDVGGGLCQMAGILYYLALQGGLTIFERHAHSHDLYTEKERYTPLGSDAAVAYGYKDLRFKNTLEIPIRFAFNIQKDGIRGTLSCSKKIIKRKVCFTIIYSGKIKKVKTTRLRENGKIEEVDTSNYRLFKFRNEK
ncbi:MAG: vancomycin resistance protein VanW [Paraglaciecola sp.]|jgi:vancomycin resistance protein VanW